MNLRKMILMILKPKHGELTEPELTNALIENQTQKVNLKSLIATQSGLTCNTQAQPKISNNMRKEKQSFVFVRPTRLSKKRILRVKIETIIDQTLQTAVEWGEQAQTKLRSVPRTRRSCRYCEPERTTAIVHPLCVWSVG